MTTLYKWRTGKKMGLLVSEDFLLSKKADIFHLTGTTAIEQYSCTQFSDIQLLKDSIAATPEDTWLNEVLGSLDHTLAEKEKEFENYLCEEFTPEQKDRIVELVKKERSQIAEDKKDFEELKEEIEQAHKESKDKSDKNFAASFKKCIKPIQKTQLIIPHLGTLVSEFAKKACDVLVDAETEIFYNLKTNRVVEVGVTEEEQKYIGFKDITPNRLITIIENEADTGLWVFKQGYIFKNQSISTNHAAIALTCDCWKDKLRKISRILTAPLPILKDGQLLLPEAGHDSRFNTWLMPGVEIDTEMPIEEAKDNLLDIYSEFVFKSPQDKTNAISHLITNYAPGLLGRWNERTPIFFFEANRERAGKDYCAAIPGLVIEGMSAEDAPISAKGKKNSNSNEELRKKITTMLKNGRRRFHSSNNAGHISNEVLENLATSQTWVDRVLGSNNELVLDNELLISLSANTGFTSTPDMINRSRFVRLELCIENANERVFKHPNLHQLILQNRPLILSSLYALIREWYAAGMPKGETPFASYPKWAEVVGGIMLHNGLGDPCAPDETASIPADRETSDMKTLCEALYLNCPGEWKKKGEILAFIRAQELEIFPYFKVDAEGKFDKSATTSFSLLINRFVNRQFNILVNGEKVTIRLEKQVTNPNNARWDLFSVTPVTPITLVSPPPLGKEKISRECTTGVTGVRGVKYSSEEEPKIETEVVL